MHKNAFLISNCRLPMLGMMIFATWLLPLKCTSHKNAKLHSFADFLLAFLARLCSGFYMDIYTQTRTHNDRHVSLFMRSEKEKPKYCLYCFCLRKNRNIGAKIYISREFACSPFWIRIPVICRFNTDVLATQFSNSYMFWIHHQYIFCIAINSNT